ncbi:MAG: class I SAM-dependent methyltransferase [Thermotogota bacterium]
MRDILKKDIEIQTKSGIHSVIVDGKKEKHSPWLMDAFSFLYDWSMKKNVYPKKLSANMDAHYDIIKHYLQNIHHTYILELGTGSGQICQFLESSNRYVGIDVSKGLLKQAVKNFQRVSNQNFSLFLASAERLPFKDAIFDRIICNLSFNFFPDQSKTISEIYRLLKETGEFFCSVPVPERKDPKSEIHGNLLTEKELMRLFQPSGFTFSSLPHQNGAILYFVAKKKGR